MKCEYWVLFFHVAPANKLFWKARGRAKWANGHFDQAWRFETQEDALAFLKDWADRGYEVWKWREIPVIDGVPQLDFCGMDLLPRGNGD